MRANSTDAARLFLRQDSACVPRLSASSSCCALGSTNLTGTPRTFPGRERAPCVHMLRKRLRRARAETRRLDVTAVAARAFVSARVLLPRDIGRTNF
eukprot:1182922-Prorocentrum_minimum.AAC.3